MKNSKVNVAILDDHQSIIDGYKYRLGTEPKIQVVSTARFGEDLEPLLSSHSVNVLLMDIRVPISHSNPNPYPFLHVVADLLKNYPDMYILVISMFTQTFLIESVMNIGVNGYICKEDDESIQNLARIVLSISRGDIYLSDDLYKKIHDEKSKPTSPLLSPRQLEVLSLCAAYPDELSSSLAQSLGVVNSTMRNLLSESYFRLNVRTRQAAIAKAQRLGLIPGNTPDQDV